MNPILEIRNISKKYQIKHQEGNYLSLRDNISNLFQSKRKSIENFWALEDVSFVVEPGESVGIIGHNGAGKSTLLKILSKITPPTSGSIISRGRIASLLEVGTGFHPELTGRENIYFNGSLLGMKKREIQIKFDEIVEFSGTEKFLDTPLKHYSSGMQLRLAFAVAAFLEPEILIIDEVLAVGDAEFQKRCLGKMQSVTKSGRTILFVSHNMGMVKQLCKRILWIDKGGLKRNGQSESVINDYLFQSPGVVAGAQSFVLGEGMTLENISISENPIKALEKAEVTFEIRSDRPVSIDSLGFFVNNMLKDRMGIIDLRKEGCRLDSGEKIRVKVSLKNISLIEGEYKLGLFLGSTLINGNFEDLLTLQVVGPQRKTGVLEYPLDVRGKLEFDYDFHIEKS